MTMDEFELTRDEVEQLANRDNDRFVARHTDSKSYGFADGFTDTFGANYDYTPTTVKWNELLTGEKDELAWSNFGVRVTIGESTDEPTFSDTALIEILEKCDVADDTARKLLESRGYSVENVVFDETGERVLPPQ